jgi:hypothetical protein
MVETTECSKSWVHVRPGRACALLTGVFRNSQDVDETIKLLQEEKHGDGFDEGYCRFSTE